MSTNENRVLNRLGARELTQEEADKVAGSKLTFASVTGTAQGGDDDFDQ
jgi:hypothetical protein